MQDGNENNPRNWIFLIPKNSLKSDFTPKNTDFQKNLKIKKEIEGVGRIIISRESILYLLLERSI